ncbi:DegT/DnrJ/EryC1/StrS family aminotransferase [Anoxybacillus gonensis]|uniref:DegT/DnrJ/EryC1/StrS family aminotransferase n=1 Tax=Anoxybacillus gonensis TaxID=198467 RepID=UPI0034E50F79
MDVYIEGVTTPYQIEQVKSGWHLYMLQLDVEKLKYDRKEIFRRLRKRKIGVHVHYIPVYWHPYYQKLGYERGICPKAERWYERALTLPIFPKMTNEDVLDVIHAVKDVVKPL